MSLIAFRVFTRDSGRRTISKKQGKNGLTCDMGLEYLLVQMAQSTRVTGNLTK